MSDIYPDLPPIPAAEAVELECLHPWHFSLTSDQLQASSEVSAAVRHLVVAHAPEGFSTDKLTQAVHDACIAVRDVLTEALSTRSEQGT